MGRRHDSPAKRAADHCAAVRRHAAAHEREEDPRVAAGRLGIVNSLSVLPLLRLRLLERLQPLSLGREAAPADEAEEGASEERDEEGGEQEEGEEDDGVPGGGVAS